MEFAVFALGVLLAACWISLWHSQQRVKRLRAQLPHVHADGYQAGYAQAVQDVGNRCVTTDEGWLRRAAIELYSRKPCQLG